MLCPKCKQELAENALKCDNCGLRVGRICPNCRSYNVLTAHTCKNCGAVLLKSCPHCGAMNTNKSITCRRCGTILSDKNVNPQESKQTVIDTIPKYEAVYYSQSNAKEKLKDAIAGNDKKIISISGDSGAGKNLVIQFVSTELKDEQLVWLMGKCSPHTKLTPCGYFQDVFLNLFNLNNFCIDLDNLKRESVKFFKQDFPNMGIKEIHDFINFLYPEKFGEFKNIHRNKQYTFNILLNIIKTIAQTTDIVFVVNNFSAIDDMSKEFVNIILSDVELMNSVKFVLTYREERSAMAYLQNDALPESAYEHIALAPLTREQLIPIFDKNKDLDLTIDQKNLIYKYSNGNPADFEQLLNLTGDKVRNGIPFSIPNNIEDVLKERLGLLKSTDNKAYLVLTAMSVLGYKSNPIILNMFDDIDLDQLDLILNKLTKLNYIVALSNSTYEFKSVKVWEYISEILKSDAEVYKKVCEELFILLQNYHLSSLAALSFIARDMNYTQQYLSVWTAGVQTASYIGDTSLFVTAQKQILKIVENNEIKSSENIKKNIYVQSGKILESIDPKESLTFLTNAIHLEGLSKYEEIELYGYIASCAKKLGNYYGVIECVDNVLDKFDDPHSVEVAVIKSRKLDALNEIGNFGEVVNLAENEIIPILESSMAKKSHKYKLVSESEVFDSWIYTLFSLVKALTRQGNDRAFTVINELFEIFEVNDIKDKQLSCELQLELALLNTIKGYIKQSEKILNDVYEIYKGSDVINSFVISRLNLISLLNTFFTDRDGIDVDELFKIASYADNINDKFTKNISKLILGKVVLSKQSAQNAIDIYKKQLEYFAKEKNAVGVLLGWYLTAEATILVDKQQSMEIAKKALNIAQKPEISNYYFSLLFDKLICKIYISLKDYDSARMYADRALTIAKGYDIKYQLAKLYLIAGDCHREMAETSDDFGTAIANVKQFYELAENINKELGISSLTKSILQKMNELDMVCKAHGVVL